MSSGMVDVHKEWERIMLKNALGTSQEKLIGPSTLMPGSNDLCCDLLENICKQSRPIKIKKTGALRYKGRLFLQNIKLVRVFITP
jgi:hypothetical protein